MKTYRVIVFLMLCIAISACGTTPTKSPAVQETGFRSPPGPPSKVPRTAGPETAMTIKISPKDSETVAAPPSPVSSEAAPETPPIPEKTEPPAKPSTQAAAADTAKPPKLPSHKGNMQTGLLSPGPQKRLQSPSFEDGEKQRVRFTFDKADVAEVTNQIFGDDFLKLNYVLDPALQGRISFYLEGEFTKEELFQMVVKAYEANNISIAPRNGIYYIQPIQKSTSSSLPIANSFMLQEEGNVRPVIVIYRLKFMDVKQAISTIKFFLTPGRPITADAMSNSLIFVEDTENARSIVEILKALDVNVLQEVSMEIVPVQAMSPQDAAQSMENLVNKLDIFKQSTLKANVAFIPLQSFGGVLILAQNPEVLKTAKTWLGALDVHGAEVGEQVYVYFVQNGLAVDIADIVSQVYGLQTGGGRRPEQRIVESTQGGSFGSFSGRNTFGSTFGSSGGGSAFGSSGGRSFGSGSSGGGFSSTPYSRGGTRTSGTFGTSGEGGVSGAGTSFAGGGTAGQRPRTAARPGQQPGQPSPTGTSLTGEPIIIPDEVNNAIVVKANSADYNKIKKTIETLDIVPRAVLIEVTIAEVLLNKNMRYGLEWFFRDIGMDLAGKSGDLRAIHGGLSSNDDSSNNNNRRNDDLITNIGTTSGLNLFWGSLDKKVSFLLQLLAEKTDVNVLSTPTLLATDNKEAAMQVGGRFPVPTGSVTGSTIGNEIFSTIDYAETGIMLSVTPHINAGGLVRLDIELTTRRADPDLIEVGTRTRAPRFTERNLKTSLLVQDQSSVVIGGIIDSSRSNEKDGIPYLQDVPIIWPLFASKGRRDERLELVIAISPRVVNHRESESTREFIDKIKELRTRISQ